MNINRNKIIDILILLLLVIFMITSLVLSNIIDNIKHDKSMLQDKVIKKNNIINEYRKHNENLIKQNQTLADVNSNKSLIFITKSDLSKFMHNNYKKTSSAIKEKILNEIFIDSKKYNISPILLFAIASQESSMRPWIRHSFRRVNVPLDINWSKHIKQDVQAVGLCGVIWEIWKFHLIKHNIAEVKSDLYDPVISIKAMAWIINFYSKQKLLPGTRNKDESATQRYFGVTDKNKYLQDINQFIGELTRNKIYRK